MSFLKRETIALAGAIVGVNLIGIMTYAKAANSNNLCDGFASMWQGTATRPAEPPKGQPIGGYWDVRTKRTEPYYREGEAPETPHVSQNGAWVEPQNVQNTGRVPATPRHTPLTTPYPPQPSTRTETLPPPPGAVAPISGELINGMTYDEYQARRRAIAVQMEGGY